NTYEASADRREAVRPLSKRAEAAVWLALSTMCRVGELSMAQFEHIDGNVWTIPGSSTKNGKPHVIYLSDFAQSQIEVLREEAAKSRSKWLFPNQAKTSHVDVKALSKQIGDRQKAITGAKRLAGRSPANDALVLPGGRWTMHDLRRTGASLMASLGVTPLVIDKCLNHVPGNVLHRVYQIHDYADEKRAAWNQLGQRLESILDGGHVVMLRRA
ncbi:MAG: site-specific integrase, partial [Pseudorhodoplanes sp.]